MSFLISALNVSELRKNKLEIYYNGERELTDFRIKCYANMNHPTPTLPEYRERDNPTPTLPVSGEGDKVKGTWKYIGLYTPDFLIIERKDELINKALIIETKGKGFAQQEEFLSRKKFIESHFIVENNKKFNYKKFEYLYVEEGEDIQSKLRNKINDFFGVKNAN